MRVLAARARDYDADIRWGHALAGFDQDRDGVTVRITGPDGPYDVRAQYLIGADGGSSVTRKLAGIEFPGMSSYDAVGRAGFDVLPPDEWMDPVSGGLDIPGYGRLPPLQFHRAERGVFAFGALGGRAALIMFERQALSPRSTRSRLPRGAPSARSPRRPCWCAPTVTWRGHRRRARPTGTNCACCATH